MNSNGAIYLLRDKLGSIYVIVDQDAYGWQGY